jgi:D-alanine-D-alanine ligase
MTIAKETAQPKIRIGVIFGGRSGEHEVSLNSAQSVMSALDPQKYEVIPIGIDKAGRWLTGDVVASLTTGNSAARTATLLPDPRHPTLLQVEMQETEPSSLAVISELDVVFPVLHGPYGEDGTVQGLLELAGIPYVGAGVVGSAVGMDKAIFKYVMVAQKIPVLPWQLVLRSSWQSAPELVLNALEQKLQYPVFTKPANLGSSVGIEKCCNRGELVTGLNSAAKFDRRIVVEQGIDARELEISVLGNDEPVASVVGEIRPQREFYDYTAKYVSDDSELIIPASLPAELARDMRATAVRAYQAIDCAGLGRVDMLLDKKSGAWFINEINTIPGFTRISMYAKLWEASGLDYSDLLDKLITLALARFAEKQ